MHDLSSDLNFMALSALPPQLQDPQLTYSGEATMLMQHTIAKPVHFSGVGVHSGRDTTVRLLPAAENHGIRFIRTDLDPPADILPNHTSILSAFLATTLGNEPGRSISTVEHLLAALVALGVDNVRAEVDGGELPILDGSAELFAQGILHRGLQIQSQPRQYLIVTKTIYVRNGQSWYHAASYCGI
ncbi:hypothetical protein CSOJ01_09989 [Colletotrichum sojae]|uniref:UDP-3-O-acyl-N-acetylglucosamine deacetylase n=1 Tax=Colletotrichum sojae TaxID=2175907 RepID=A0A8H6J1I3_9PEZI|nr:hypothetical protein CSOJ01_09989 [Colletotrichum sojae]